MTVDRIWFGPVGEWLGAGTNGTPVVATREGVEPMVEITDMIEGFHWDIPPAVTP